MADKREPAQMNVASTGFEAHPIIAALEKADASTVVFEGFMGTRQDAAVRLYETLNTASYVEIPNEAIVHLHSDEREKTGAVRVFVRASAEILSVRRARVLAGTYTAGPPPITFPQPQARNFWTCAKRAENHFEREANAIGLEWEGCRNRHPENPSRAAVCQAPLEQRKVEAKDWLWESLLACVREHGRPLNVLGRRPFQLGEFYQEIVDRHMPF